MFVVMCDMTRERQRKKLQEQKNEQRDRGGDAQIHETPKTIAVGVAVHEQCCKEWVCSQRDEYIRTGFIPAPDPTSLSS